MADLVIGMTLETDAARKFSGERETIVEGTKDVARETESATSAMERSWEGFEESVTDAARRVEGAETDMESLLRSVDRLAREVREAEDESEDFGAALDEMATDARQAERATEDAADQVRQLHAEAAAAQLETRDLTRELLEMARAAAEVEEEVDDAGDSTSRLGDGLGRLRGFAGTTAAALGTLALGALDLSRRTGESLDQIDRISTISGANVGTIQALGVAFRSVGGDIDDVGEIFDELNAKAVEAGEGGNEAAEGFEILGIETRDAAGNIRPVNELLDDVIEGLRTAPDQATATRGAMALLGDDLGRKLLPALQSVDGDLGSVEDSLRSAGAVMDDEARQAAEDYRDSTRELDIALTGLTQTVGTSLIPILASGATIMADFASRTRAAYDSVADAVQGAVTGGGALDLVFDGLEGQSSLPGFLGAVAGALASIRDQGRNAAEELDDIRAFEGITALGLDAGPALSEIAQVQDALREAGSTEIGIDPAPALAAVEGLLGDLEELRPQIDPILDPESAGRLLAAVSRLTEQREVLLGVTFDPAQADTALDDVRGGIATGDPVEVPLEVGPNLTDQLANLTLLRDLGVEINDQAAELVEERVRASDTEGLIAIQQSGILTGLENERDLLLEIATVRGQVATAILLQIPEQRTLTELTQQRLDAFRNTYDIANLTIPALEATGEAQSVNADEAERWQRAAENAEVAIQEGIGEGLGAAVQGAEDFRDVLEDIAGRVLQSIVDQFASLIPGGSIISGFVGSFFHEGGKVKKFHDGGALGGNSRLGPREVPIIAEEGEVIFSREESQRGFNAGAFDFDASGRPRFADPDQRDRFHDGGALGGNTFGGSATVRESVRSTDARGRVVINLSVRESVRDEIRDRIMPELARSFAHLGIDVQTGVRGV